MQINGEKRTERKWTRALRAFPADLKAAPRFCLGQSGLLGKQTVVWVDSWGLWDHHQSPTPHTQTRK